MELETIAAFTWCDRCSAPIESGRYCAPCGKQRNGARAFKRARERQDPTLKAATRFVAVDGEGVTLSDGSHRYVLLSVGSDSISDPDGLPWWVIFDFLYESFQLDPDAAYVGFYLGYDFGQWLKSLPEERARMLLTDRGVAARKPRAGSGRVIPFPVSAHTPAGTQWEFDILGMKRFKLRPAGEKRWMSICDAGPFFQSSFLAAVDPARNPGICTDDEYSLLIDGKANRATAVLDNSMVAYNLLENRILSQLMEQLETGFRQMGVTLGRDEWFGPGQAAQHWLREISAPTREDVESVVPADVRRFAKEAYYGGWFETFAVGHAGDAWEYDINSAYPAEIANLPCMLHGRWHYGVGPAPAGAYTIVRTRLIAPAEAVTGPAPARMSDGSIWRPLQVEGVYWQRELDAASRAGLVASRADIEWWNYEPCECPRPFFKIENLYLKRLALGKNTPAGKAAKLLYNSTYGKMAQSIGSPRYANAIYASLITMGCRSRILDAIATHPTGGSSLLMVATDGVYFSERHPSLDIDPARLGAWDETEKRNLTLLMPGVYWDDKARQAVARGEALGIKSRGVSAAAVGREISSIDSAFDALARRVQRGEDPDWPAFTLRQGFEMITPRAALARRKWTLAGTIIQDKERRLSSDPSAKRFAEGAEWRDGRVFVPPHDPGTVVVSKPYEKSFGDQGDETVSPDGMLPHNSLTEMMQW